MNAQLIKANNGGNGRCAGRNGNGTKEALRESEERCRQLQDRLIQAEKLASLGTLVSGMAHEINNPIQCIFGMAEIILDEQDPAKIREYAQDIIRLARGRGGR